MPLELDQIATLARALELRDCSSLRPLVGIAIFLFIAVGIYLIGKGVNRDFDLLQTGTGYLFLLSGLVALAVGIIHGDLVPRFLTVSENVSTAPGIDVSATCYRLSKNIRVQPVVVSELKLSNIERHVLGADLVECADNAAFQDRPEPFNRVGVNRANNVLVFAVLDVGVRKFLTEFPISAP